MVIELDVTWCVGKADMDITEFILPSGIVGWH
jgi:hypothetical protein